MRTALSSSRTGGCLHQAPPPGRKHTPREEAHTPEEAPPWEEAPPEEAPPEQTPVKT